jgi:hypothetical protein
VVVMKPRAGAGAPPPGAFGKDYLVSSGISSAVTDATRSPR